MNELKNIRHAALLTSLLIIINSCSKYDPPKCELWEVRDYEYSTGNSGCGIDWSCGGSRTMQFNFCGDALDDARVGILFLLRMKLVVKKQEPLLEESDYLNEFLFH